MQRLFIAGTVWLGFLSGLLAVAIANRPDHKTVVVPGTATSYLDSVIGGTQKNVSAPLLEAWSSTYTLVLVLGTIALAVALVALVSMRNQEHAR